MSVNIKNSVIILALLLVSLPFVLVTDLFPFMRFGMFAEPVKSVNQKEIFLLTFKDRGGNLHEFNPKEAGLEPHIFYYLTRNYFYRNETDKLIHALEVQNPNREVSQWQLKRIILKDSLQNSSADTTTVFIITNEK